MMEGTAPRRALLLVGLAALAAAPGCGLSLTAGGIGYVLTSDKDDDETPIPNSPPAGFVTTPAGLVNDVIRVEYRVIDAESDPVNVRVTWSSDGGATFLPLPPLMATAATGLPEHEGVANLATSPAGTVHVFLWNSYSDLLNGGKTDNFSQVRVRVEVTQVDGIPGPLLTTGTFAVWNRYTASVAGGQASPYLANIVTPAGFSRASDGDLIVADPIGQKVARLDYATGAITVVAGTGVGGFNGDNLPATTAQLNYPYDAAVDAAGNVYIADAGNSSIRRVDAVTGFISTVAGGNGSGFGGDGGDPRFANLGGPLSVDVDSLGNLYIADSGSDRIRFVNRTGAAITFTFWDATSLIAGSTVQLVVQPNTIETIAGGTGGGLSPIGDKDDPRQATIDRPNGIRLINFFGINLGLVFSDTKQDRVRIVSFVPPTTPSNSSATFFGRSVPNGTLDTIAGGGPTPPTGVGDGLPATSAILNDPIGTTQFLGGLLLIADSGHNRIRMVDPLGTISTLINIFGGFGFGGDGGVPQLATLASPLGVLMDQNLNIFVSDAYNSRLRMVNLMFWNDVFVPPASTTATAVGGNGAILRTDGTTFSVSGVNAPELLIGVHGSSASDVVAVGYEGGIYRWNGLGWSKQASGTSQLLSSVFALSATNQVAVGIFGTILRYNGSTWSAETSGTTQFLSDVWGATGSAIFAVGSQGTVLNYGGSSWTTMSSGTTVDLDGVTGSSATSVWAVGDGGLIRYYNGSTWTTQGGGVTTQDLKDVWAADASNVFAAGDGGTILRTTNGGGTWSLMTVPTNFTDDVNGIYGSSATNVFAVAADDTVLRWNGSNWTILPTASSVTYAGTIVGAGTIESLTQPPPVQVAAIAEPKGVVLDASGNVFFTNSGTHQVMKLDMTTRATTVVAGTGRSGYGGDGGPAGPSGAVTSQNLNAVWGPSATDLIAVGAGGTIIRWSGVSWTSVASPVTAGLRGVHGTSGSNAFAVGEQGTFLRWNGTAWTSLATGTTLDLNGVFAVGATDVFAVGQGGLILRWNGIQFTDMTSGMANGPRKAFYGVWASSASDVFAVGEGSLGSTQGPIWHWNGTSWSRHFGPDLTNFLAVFGDSGTRVLAVGEYGGLGAVYSWNGSAWASETSATGSALRTVFGRPGTEFFSAGDFGTLESRPAASTTWTATTTNTTVQFRGGIAFTGGPAFVVGEAGTIFRQTSAGGAFSLLAGQSVLSEPTGLALRTISGQSVLLVADSDNGRIRAVNLGTSSVTFYGGSTTPIGVNPGAIATVAGGGPAVAGDGDGGFATSASLAFPAGIVVDPATGTLYVSDTLHHRIRQVNPTTGIITNFAGSGTAGFGGDGGSATAAACQLNTPIGVTFDALYPLSAAVADDSGTLTTQSTAANDATTNDMALYPASLPTLNDAYYLGHGSVWSGLRLQVGQAANGATTQPVVTWEYYRSTGVWAALSGVSDGTVSFRVAGLQDLLFTTPTDWATTTVNGISAYWVRARVTTAPAGTWTQGLGTQAWVRSYSTAVAATASDLYIADAGNHVIRRVRTQSNDIVTVAGLVIASVPQPGFNSDNLAPTATKLLFPYGVFLAEGDFHVLDAGNSRIRKVSGGVVQTVAGTGSFSFNGDPKPGVNADLNAPGDAAWDPVKGSIFIADSGNNRVRRFRP